jgi:hypothetical protein
MTRNLVLRIALPVLLGAGACDGGKSRCTSSDWTYDLAIEAGCDSSDSCDECASPGACVPAMCLAAGDGNTCLDPSAHGSICTISCGSDSDCARLAPSGACESVGQVTTSEQWNCVNGFCFDYYVCGTVDPCNGCGGAFCAGRCTGCPGC